MSLTFKSAKKRAKQEPIPFTLDGEEFLFTPVKTTAVWLAADARPDERARVQLNWLSTGLPEEQSQRILDRLADYDDLLTVLDVIGIVAKLMEEVAGRPTGPSPG